MTSFDEMTNTFTIKDLLIQWNQKMKKHSVTGDKNINVIALMNKGQIQQSSNIIASCCEKKLLFQTSHELFNKFALTRKRTKHQLESRDDLTYPTTKHI